MDPIILIFVAIAAVCVGFLLGFMVRLLTHPGADSDKADAGSKKGVKKRPNRNWTEVANLWRDRRDGRLVFQIENKHYKRGGELTARERKILLKVVMDFYRWLEPPNAIPSRPEEPANPGTAVEDKPAQDLAPKMAPEMLPDVSFEEPAKPTTETKPPPGIVARALSSSITTPETPSLSMVAQVDSILQEKLEAAEMQKWAIRLTESADKAMIVWVGMERYEWIDDVPYKRVRSIIRESVAEWEQRSEAG